MDELPQFERGMLNDSFNSNQKMVTSFEELIRQLQLLVTTATGASQAVVDAAGTAFIVSVVSTVFPNSSVITDGRGITITLADGLATISHPIEVLGGNATFILVGDTSLAFPQTGTVATTADIPAFFATLAASTSYANDAAAAVGGVPVGGTYRNGSVVQIRIT